MREQLFCCILPGCQCDIGVEGLTARFRLIDEAAERVMYYPRLQMGVVLLYPWENVAGENLPLLDRQEQCRCWCQEGVPSLN